MSDRDDLIAERDKAVRERDSLARSLAILFDEIEELRAVIAEAADSQCGCLGGLLHEHADRPGSPQPAGNESATEQHSWADRLFEQRDQAVAAIERVRALADSFEAGHLGYLTGADALFNRLPLNQAAIEIRRALDEDGAAEEEGSNPVAEAIDVIANVILDFPFWDYWLTSEIDPHSKHAEWVRDLAAKIAAVLAVGCLSRRRPAQIAEGRWPAEEGSGR